MPSMFRSLFILPLILTLCIADAIEDDIAEAKNLDELVVKMNNAPHKNRYRYMNAIKKMLMNEKAQERKSKLDAAINSHQENSKSQKNQGGFGNNTNGTNRGGNGGGGNGGGGGKR